MRISWFNKHRPPVNWLLLCLVSIFMLIALLGSSSSSSSSTAFDSITSTAKADIYVKNRKLKQLAVNDLLDLRTFYSGANRTKYFDLCGKDRENFVPCYNVSANMLAGLRDGEELDRHCEISGSNDQGYCLVRPPKDYKIPLNWPAGRDVIWSGNVKLSKDQFLSSGSMTKR